MFTVFMLKSNPTRFYITTPDKFSSVINTMGYTHDEVFWANVSLEFLMLLKDRQKDYIVLK